jgi:hypothetical protein
MMQAFLEARTRIVCCLVVAGLLMGLAAMAQTGPQGTFVGTVTDSSGAVIAGAKVTIVNTGTQFVSEVTTNAEGNYYVPYLNSGTYKLTISASGFKQNMRDGIELRPGDSPRYNASLEVGAMSDTVTVTGESPLLNTESASVTTALGQEILQDVSNVQKRIVRQLYYMPGVVGAGDTGYHILGGVQRSIGYTLDGIGGKWPGLGTFDQNDQVIQTTQDALEEVKVQSSGQSAEFGHMAGGGLQLTFKSGANMLHGSLEDRFLRTPMVHRHYFQTLAQQPFRYDAVEGTFSGPVVFPKLYDGRNKTFFLYGMAAHIEDWYSESTTNVPSLEMLNGDFSFGGQGYPLYDPKSIRQVNNVWTSDPIANNLVPKAQWDPVAVNFLARNPWVKPNNAGTVTPTGPSQNLIATGEKPIKRIRFDIKIDHQFTYAHKMFGRYSHAFHRAARGGYNPQLAWTDLDSNRQPAPIDLNNGVISDTYLLSPTRFNDIRVGYNRRRYTGDSLTYGQDWGKQLGIPGVGAETFPNFNVGYGFSPGTRDYYAGEEITLADNFTQVVGTHNIKVGYEMIRARYNQAAGVYPSGNYNFGGTGFPFKTNTGNGFASFLLGSVTSASFSQRFANWLPRWTMHAGYIQDDWKVRPGLTVNVGLRWSYETPFHTKYDQQSQFDPNGTDALTGGKGALLHPKGFLGRSDWNNFQPRLGLSWNFAKKFVFRSSFGVMSQDVQAGGNSNQNFQDYNGSYNISRPTGDPSTAFFLSQGPGPITYATAADGTVPWVGTSYNSRNVTWLDPGLRNPYIMNWSAGIQWQFAYNWLVEARYEGSAGNRLLGSWNINEIPLSITLGGDTALQNTVWAAQQNYKPYTKFGNITLISNFNHNTYHSGSLRLERRLHNGFTMTSFYTYAKNLSAADNEGGGGITYYNRSLEKSRTSYDVRHHFNVQVTYDLPFGKGRRWLSQGGVFDYILGGWGLSVNDTLDSGMPSSIGFSGSPNKYLTPGQRIVPLTKIEDALTPNWSIGPNRFPTTAPPQTPYLKASSFAYPASYTTGFLGKYVYESPGMHGMGFAVKKTWTFKERFKSTFRLDAHNLPFKQPNFSRPASTWNVASPQLFGYINSARGAWSEYGYNQATIQLGVRFEF